ncbi:hypothetical protein [Deefgea rivuli]|uniref:hypothetical protein n=1 Tax=Deefgea rivuli TaxID=400948 RepID=UPI00047F3FB6|nr:hypothetical protein [Deefgea rivuli]
MDNATFTSLATGLLVLVGLAQAAVLVGQRRQQRLDWSEVYRRRWAEAKEDFAKVVFLGRQHGAYYQVADPELIQKLNLAVAESSLHTPTIWALASVRNVCGILSDICQRIMQGQLHVQEAYPLFGTEFLRHSAALRSILDGSYLPNYGRLGPSDVEKLHESVRQEVKTWLVCHDGIRRRCLILIDLLWAEAARLEDLPPADLTRAAEAKKTTGKRNRTRLLNEVLRLNGLFAIFRGLRLSRFLRHAEYRRSIRRIGLNPKRLEMLETEWTSRYLGS